MNERATVAAPATIRRVVDRQARDAERRRGFWGIEGFGYGAAQMPREWLVVEKGKCQWCRGPAYSPRATWCGYDKEKCYSLVFDWWWSATAIRRAVFVRDNFTCKTCGAAPTTVIAGREVPLLSAFHADHIVPIVAGGKTTAANLQTLCAKCNLSKGAKTC